MGPEVGATAPPFTLRDHNNQRVCLSDLLGGRHVLLVFFPFAFTGICQGELTGIQDAIDTFQNDGVAVLGISCDSVYALKVWAGREGYTFPLLSDRWPTGAVARDYGVFNEALGVANRGTVLVDRTGVVVRSGMNQPGEPRDLDVWHKAVAAL